MPSKFCSSLKLQDSSLDWPFVIVQAANLFYIQFHFEQSKIRSEIRLREGRVKPIDILTKHLDPSDDLDIEINEPYMVFKVNTLDACSLWII